MRLVILLVSLLPLAGASHRLAGAAGPVPAPVRTSAQSASWEAPAFSLVEYENGRTLSLGDLRGKVVLLYFWFPT